jgi:hypothetical protein
MLYDKLRLLQWLNLFSSVFQFSLLLVALTARREKPKNLINFL